LVDEFGLGAMRDAPTTLPLSSTSTKPLRRSFVAYGVHFDLADTFARET
jgi:hypothetical protein